MSAPRRPRAGGPGPAQGRAGRRAKKKRRLFSGAQTLALSALLAVCALGLSYFLISSASLRDQEAVLRQRQEAYERKVYRTTVKYRDLIERSCAEYGVRPAYAAAIILNESSYDPSAVSSVGARGLMQLLPDTGRWIAGKIGLDMTRYTDDWLFDAEINIRMGVWYLHYLSDLYGGDPVLVACAYHAGHGNVDAWLNRYSADGRTLAISEIPTDNTRSYAAKVVDSYAVYLENYYRQ